MRVLFFLSFVMMVASLYFVFIYSPIEAKMGIVQKIFYFHMPLGVMGLFAFFVVFTSSILYLKSRKGIWDILAYSSAEVGFIFTSLNIISGILWAKPVWGVWWVWDARLTSMLVLWLIYLAYFLVRGFAIEEERGARLSSVVGIIGFIDVPIVFMAIRWWRTMHPQPVIERGGLAPPMFYTLLICLVAFTVLYVYLLLERISLRRMEEEVRRLS